MRRSQGGSRTQVSGAKGRRRKPPAPRNRLQSISGVQAPNGAAAAASPSPQGALAALAVPALAAAEAPIATTVATAVSAALAAHLAALTATHDHPRPMPHVSRAAALCGR